LINETPPDFNGNDSAMTQANEDARRSFKYFWRELTWERQRIVPGLDTALVKLPFSDGARTDGRPEYEHMWVDEIDFDSDTISGRLRNAPKWLTSVRNDDFIRLPFAHLSDWLICASGRAYGGHTINLMRSNMGLIERKQHDDAWGLDFGDPSSIRLEITRDDTTKRGLFLEFRDHPMCLNMLEQIQAQLKADPTIVQAVGKDGMTVLHKEALAGNFAVVKLLVDSGADLTARSATQRTASELAYRVGWFDIAEYLDRQIMATK
jgi:uncharacterized protein YegJ (DUF2314 family)